MISVSCYCCWFFLLFVVLPPPLFYFVLSVFLYLLSLSLPVHVVAWARCDPSLKIMKSTTHQEDRLKIQTHVSYLWKTGVWTGTAPSLMCCWCWSAVTHCEIWVKYLCSLDYININKSTTDNCNAEVPYLHCIIYNTISFFRILRFKTVELKFCMQLKYCLYIDSTICFGVHSGFSE